MNPHLFIDFNYRLEHIIFILQKFNDKWRPIRKKYFNCLKFVTKVQNQTLFFQGITALNSTTP